MKPGLTNLPLFHLDIQVDQNRGKTFISGYVGVPCAKRFMVDVEACGGFEGAIKKALEMSHDSLKNEDFVACVPHEVIESILGEVKP